MPGTLNCFPMISSLKRSHFRFFPALAVCFALACNSPQQEENHVADSDSANAAAPKDTSAGVNAAKNIVRSIPSPLQVASMFKKAGIQYRGDVLNPTTNVSGYTNNFSKAVNLGVYVADLAYAELNDQTQISVNYFKACKTLADELGVTNLFESSGLNARIQNNVNNKDSLLLIVADLNRDMINFFRDNGRGNIATLAMAGGWVEGLYIATKLVEKTPNEKIVARVAEQKLLLNNLVLLLSAYKDEPESSNLLKELLSIQELYNGVAINYSGHGVTTEAKSNKTVMNATSTVTMSNEQLKKISEKIASLRNSITGKKG